MTLVCNNITKSLPPSGVMATTFHTQDPKLAYKCRKAQREGAAVTVSAEVRGRLKELTGRVIDVAVLPNPGKDVTWEITIADC